MKRRVRDVYQNQMSNQELTDWLSTGQEKEEEDDDDED